MENAAIYGQRGEVPEDPDFTVPFGQAAVRREGTDVTLVAYSNMVLKCLKAAEALENDGIHCEVIDLRTLVPLDIDTVIRSVRKTHRAVAAQDEWKNVGMVSELAAQISELAFDDLDAPVERVGGAQVPMPYAKNLERAAIPTDQDIIAAVRRTLA
jgi:pyruvate dehydrogenase E1 component beta subunit